jgi:hypothetical protein
VVELVIQWNGKLKAKMILPVDEAKDEKKVLIEAQKALQIKGIPGGEFQSYKFVPGRLINFIAPQKTEAKK